MFYEYPTELYEERDRILNILNQQTSLEGFDREIFNEQKAYDIAHYLVERKHRTNEECRNCGFYTNKKGKDYICGYYFDTPWEEEGEERCFCSNECRESYENGDSFAYFWCDACGRTICEQNPANGWQIQYRMLDYEQICLKCYEEHILENGIDREKFLRNEIPGMFFSWGNTEAEDAGYEEVEGFTNYFVGDERPFCQKAVEMIDSGYKVIVGYESMAIGGLEGTVTMLVKKGE